MLYHHERSDGSGFPSGVAGSVIPLEASLVGLCDAFCELTQRDRCTTARAVAQLETTWPDRDLLGDFREFAATNEFTLEIPPVAAREANG